MACRGGHSQYVSSKEKGSLAGKRYCEVGGKGKASLFGIWPEATAWW